LLFLSAISKAYATLSDPSRRNHYDRFGEDGLRAMPAAAAHPDDYLRFVFNDTDDFFHFFEENGKFINNALLV
jgi:DnaJ-class molecular chaperone